MEDKKIILIGGDTLHNLGTRILALKDATYGLTPEESKAFRDGSFTFVDEAAEIDAITQDFIEKSSAAEQWEKHKRDVELVSRMDMGVDSNYYNHTSGSKHHNSKWGVSNKKKKRKAQKQARKKNR